MDLGVDQSMITLDGDIESELRHNNNLVFHERTKYIDVRFHFIREIISSGKVGLLKVSDEDISADALTKRYQSLSFVTASRY